MSGLKLKKSLLKKKNKRNTYKLDSESKETNPAQNQKQKSNKGVKKGTVRGPYKKKSQAKY